MGNFNKVKSESVIAACSKVIAEPGHSKYWQAAALRYIGESHVDLGNYQQALPYFEKSLAYNSSDDDTYTNRGDVYIKLRMTKEAISSYERAVRVATSDLSKVRNYQKLAIIYNDQGEYDFAIAYMDKAIERAPDSPEFIKGNLYKNRGTMWSNKGDSDRARADYAKSIEFNSKR